MVKEDALVVQETTEIVELLPFESRSDVELIKAIAGSLKQGHDLHEVRIQALEISKQRLEAKVDKGFELVGKELQTIKHEAEKERIHSEYARKEAKEAKQEVAQLWRSLYEVQTVAKVADVKADGAKEAAKTNRNAFLGIDPLLIVLTSAIALTAIFALINIRIERPQDTQKQPQRSTILCGQDVRCNFNGNPTDFKGGV